MKNIHIGLSRSGSSTTFSKTYCFEANAKRTCFIKLGKKTFLQFNLCFTQLITHSNTWINKYNIIIINIMKQTTFTCIK